jgi:hypothetical protein
MSNNDSFIDEVTEEVRKDRLYGWLRRYGWIPVLVILAIVGGTSWSEYRKAQTRNAAEIMGDRMLAALEEEDELARAEALSGIDPTSPASAAILRFMQAAVLLNAGTPAPAIEHLGQIAADGEVPQIYRQIAGFKLLLAQADTLPAAERRLQFEALAAPGAPLRLLAEEQLALIDIEDGARDAAIERFQNILQDAEASVSLQQRAAQAIVALGGTPLARGAG